MRSILDALPCDMLQFLNSSASFAQGSGSHFALEEYRRLVFDQEIKRGAFFIPSRGGSFCDTSCPVVLVKEILPKNKGAMDGAETEKGP